MDDTTTLENTSKKDLLKLYKRARKRWSDSRPWNIDSKNAARFLHDLEIRMKENPDFAVAVDEFLGKLREAPSENIRLIDQKIMSLEREREYWVEKLEEEEMEDDSVLQRQEQEEGMALGDQGSQQRDRGSKL